MNGRRGDFWARFLFGLFVFVAGSLVFWQSIGELGNEAMFGAIVGLFGIFGGGWIMFGDHTERWTRNK